MAEIVQLYEAVQLRAFGLVLPVVAVFLVGFMGVLSGSIARLGAYVGGAEGVEGTIYVRSTVGVKEH